jgi:hypothetical protein
VKLHLYRAVESYKFETSRLPHCLDSRLTDGADGAGLMRLTRFLPPGRLMVLMSVIGSVNLRLYCGWKDELNR